MLDHALHPQQDLFDKLLMVLWALWKNRNNKLWNDSCQTANDLVLGSMTWLEEFEKARKLEKQPKQARNGKTWKPALHGKWKLNVDGSFLPHSTKGGVGGVLRDSSGHFKAGFVLQTSYAASAKHVELMAIKEGLELLRNLLARNVILETDCLEATQDIRNYNHERVVEGRLIDDIKATECILYVLEFDLSAPLKAFL
ncbi:uncharacterized protein LOC133729159 [Rosa rugosa]|uniref:uncharacterized protein LOC133729159 n=1 Tax=Rosa rugosa TaxID=74645 RepID=UPI002B407805|nr:uncharacterized protein LOC133729159 [Rosa rugosa]